MKVFLTLSSSIIVMSAVLTCPSIARGDDTAGASGGSGDTSRAGVMPILGGLKAQGPQGASGDTSRAGVMPILGGLKASGPQGASSDTSRAGVMPVLGGLKAQGPSGDTSRAGVMPSVGGLKAPDPQGPSGDTSRAGVMPILGGLKAQGSQGIGLGFMTGKATDASQGVTPQTLQLEYFSLGKNPSESGRGYGLREDKIEFSGVSNGLPQMALEGRGMSGWQIIGAGDKRPVMFHLGIEPLNFEGQVTSNVVSDAKNEAARIAQSKPNQKDGGGQQIGNPDAPVLRNQWGYYVPALSAGIEVRKLGCRFLALVRGGAAGGGQLRTDGYSYGVSPAYGLGASVNCPKFDVDGEWTRIQQSDAPMDLINADVMYKPFTNVPLAVGAELGSTVTNSQDPKSVSLALPGYGVSGASVETHASGVVRVVF